MAAPSVPAHLDVRMRTWERTLGPQFQRQRVLQWTPEAQRLWDSQRLAACGSTSHDEKLLWGIPKWTVVVLGAIVLLLFILLIIGGIKWFA